MACYDSILLPAMVALKLECPTSFTFVADFAFLKTDDKLNSLLDSRAKLFLRAVLAWMRR